MTVCNELAAATGFMIRSTTPSLAWVQQQGPQVLFLCVIKVFKWEYKSMFGRAPLNAVCKHGYVYIRGMEFHFACGESHHFNNNIGI